VNWACLGAGVVACVLSLTALWPLRGALGSGLSFLPSWIVSESPLHLLAVIGAAMLGLGRAGAFSSWPGWAGLALAAVACIGLVVQFASALHSGAYFKSALAEAGHFAADWHWDTQDTRHVVSPLPIRPRGVERIRDLAYVDDDRRAHRLDLYRRAEPGRIKPGRTGSPGLTPDLAEDSRVWSQDTGSPVLLYFHGGAWMIGDKREQGIPMLGHLAQAGCVCVSANYALSPKGKWPQHVLDCKMALAWVKRHIAEYGGDPGLVFLSGGSAGGHLAALVALTANDPKLQPGFEDENTAVAGCVPLYGVYDFVDPDKIGPPGLGSILERRVFERPVIEELAAASPISRVSESAPPFLVVHGRNDVLVPVASARAFVAALRERTTGSVAYAELPLAQHAFDNFWSARTVHLVHAVESFITAIVAGRTAEGEVKR